MNAPKLVRLAPHVALAVSERYPVEIEQHGMSWVVSWLVAYTLGLSVPETPVEGKARGGKRKKGKK